MAETENNPDAEPTGADEPAEAEEPKRFQSETETVGPCKVEVRVTIPPETIEAELDDRYREIIRTVAFPGFRVGHAPRRLVEKKLGDDVRGDVRESLLADSFKDAVETHGIEMLHEPDLDLEGLEVVPGQPLEYSVTLVVRPSVTVPDLDKIVVQGERVEVTDEMVEEALEEFRRRHAVLESVPDGKVEERDTVILDFEAVVGDEKILAKENVEYHHPAPYVGGLPVEGLKDACLGKGAGDEFTVTQTLPDAWPQPDQAGQEMTVEFSVKDVKRHSLPELTDEFAVEQDYDDLEDLTEEVREAVERRAEQEARDLTDRRILDALIEAAPFDLPEDVVREEASQRIERKRAILRMHGADEEELEEKLAEALGAAREEVEREFRAAFLLSAIATQEKIFVTESQVEERVAQMAAGYNRSVEEMKEYLEQRDMMGSIRSGMREEKVMELLRRKVNIEEAK